MKENIIYEKLLEESSIKEIYLAGGCFWCIESVYSSLDGVKDVISGYCGGDNINPTYENVKKQLTNHRETIKVIYDASKITYKNLLDIFYDSVDPFDDGGQFIDRGRSYTLAIYYQDDNEKDYVKSYLEHKQSLTSNKIKISIEKLKTFYNAEEYHQHYGKKNPLELEKELIESGRKKST